MKERYGDMWEVAHEYTAACITTNGSVRSDGKAVMGRGCALQAASKWGNVPRRLGRLIRANGNVVSLIGLVIVDNGTTRLVSFPVKIVWSARGNLGLIATSARQLVEMADERNWSSILLPRPGCGNGSLKWSDVRPVIAPLLDSRFTVITRRETDR